MAKKRFIFLTDANTFPLLGGGTLQGCRHDSLNLINRLLLGIWKTGGYDKAFLLSDTMPNALNDAPLVRQRMAEICAAANAGDVIVKGNSSHGADFVDWLTQEKMQVTVCHKSTWDDPKSFISRLDYQRIYEKYLKPGVRVFDFYDSCESGHMGVGFRLLESLTRQNRWLETPQDVQDDIKNVPMADAAMLRAVKARVATQVCTMAGCQHPGTCADIGGPDACGLFSRTRDNAVLEANSNAKGRLKWYALANKINLKFAADNEEQRCVPDGPDVPFDLD